MNPDKILQLDPIIHAPTRLAVLSVLISVESANFTYLKDTTGTTDGNLSTHLSKLEEQGYITIEKTFQGKKPLTTCAITKKGRAAFLQYLEQMEHIIGLQKNKS